MTLAIALIYSLAFIVTCVLVCLLCDRSDDEAAGVQTDEDAADALLIESRRGGETIPLDAVLAAMNGPSTFSDIGAPDVRVVPPILRSEMGGLGERLAHQTSLAPAPNRPHLNSEQHQRSEGPKISDALSNQSKGAEHSRGTCLALVGEHRNPEASRGHSDDECVGCLGVGMIVVPSGAYECPRCEGTGFKELAR